MLFLTRRNIQKAVEDSGLGLSPPDRAPLYKNSVPLSWPLSFPVGRRIHGYCLVLQSLCGFLAWNVSFPHLLFNVSKKLTTRGYATNDCMVLRVPP